MAVLARACGIHPKKSIYEAMNKLLTKDVASKYNITGTAKKCNFCTEFKNIYSAIIGINTKEQVYTYFIKCD